MVVIIVNYVAQVRVCLRVGNEVRILESHLPGKKSIDNTYNEKIKE